MHTSGTQGFQSWRAVLFVSFAANHLEVIIGRSPYEVTQQSFEFRNANAVLTTAPFDKSAARVKMKAVLIFTGRHAWDMCCSYANPQLELQPGFWWWDQDAGCWIMLQKSNSQLPTAFDFFMCQTLNVCLVGFFAGQSQKWVISTVCCKQFPAEGKIKSLAWNSSVMSWSVWKRLLTGKGLNLKINAEK